MSDDRQKLLARADALPAEPGVYIFFDHLGRVVYVGKAASLRARVRSYFQPGAGDGRPLYPLIIEQTASLECVVCANDLEALLLENNLIKKHRPRYNVRLRDDKSYVSLRVTTAEEWPRVQVVRGWKEDGNAYFGPYSAAGAVRTMLRVIKRFIPLRTCSNGFFKSRTRPCLEFEIGHCSAPCVGRITAEEYKKHVLDTLLFLKGNSRELIAGLEGRMGEAASAREFERAARYRDEIAAIRSAMEKQKVQEVALADADVFGLHRENDYVSVHTLICRGGKLLESATHSFRTPLADDAVLSSSITQYYQGDRFLPELVLLPSEFADRPLVEEWLRTRSKRKIALMVPRRGVKRELVEMACRNAEANSAAEVERLRARERVADSLAARLELAGPLRTIECYDISGWQGTLQVASRVVFEHGEPAPACYRRYKIKGLEGANDFAAMEEVLTRRFRRTPEAGGEPPPDLIVVDGGKGQLSSALQALARAGVAVPVIGLAKERRKAGDKVPERVFVPGRSQPIDLAADSAESLLLQRIRDEAHRFANRFQGELRRKSGTRAGLAEIPGIGAKRRAALLDHFGSLRVLMSATVDEIAAVPGLPRPAAEAVHRYLREKAPRT